MPAAPACQIFYAVLILVPHQLVGVQILTFRGDSNWLRLGRVPPAGPASLAREVRLYAVQALLTHSSRAGAVGNSRKGSGP